ncbi:MAG: hypothetical protein GX847_03160 [Clostridiales bacterium]|nr:hypothetical protein [Clostridiales bacterium]
MIQQKSTLTVVMKILSILALLYSMYTLVSLVILYINMSDGPAILYVICAEVLVSAAVNVLLVWFIFAGKDASALFLPSLILGSLSALVLAANIIIVPLSYVNSVLWQDVLRGILGTVIHLVIAIDARSGSKFALPEAIILAVFYVLRTFIYIITLGLKLLSHDTTSSVFFKTASKNIISLIFSTTAVIVLFLLRTHIQRQKSAIPPPQPWQPPQ